jgi:Alpha amylase, catalytic domain
MNPTNASDLDFAAITAGPRTPSPSAWEDEVVYFVLVDRFSNNQEDGYSDLWGNPVSGSTPLFASSDNGNAITSDTDAENWRTSGVRFAGGNVAGIRGKLGYLSRLGVTALWISPVLKQTHPSIGPADNYHGYATQDFLTVEPHLGSAAELRDLVQDAHQAGLRVILDVVLNHAGDVFSYDLHNPNRYPSNDPKAPPGTVQPRWDGDTYPVVGWRDGQGGLVPFTPAAAAGVHPDGAVFPAELHPAETFTREGQISNFNYEPEMRDGDFFDLKDIHHGTGPTDTYTPSPALKALARCYCWWIAFADLDGFRVDTVKHMDPGATRYFTSIVHEFAQSLGKDRFLLIGEDTGSRVDAIDRMELTGLDADLGLADVQYQIEAVVKGRSNPDNYFSLFRNSELLGKARIPGCAIPSWSALTITTRSATTDTRDGSAPTTMGQRWRSQLWHSTPPRLASPACTTAASSALTAAAAAISRTGTSVKLCSAAGSVHSVVESDTSSMRRAPSTSS